MKCPICARKADPAKAPFCSQRCSDVDLARWLNGTYAIPAEATEDDTPPDGDAFDTRPQ